MGLFDKLREMAEVALGSVDSPKKKYYDFTLNLLSTVKCLTKEDIKKCYRVKMGEDCDDTVLETVLTKFDTSTEPTTRETWYKRTIKQEYDEKIPASLLLFKNADEVYDICFSDFQEGIRVRFAEVLDTVKNCADTFHLEQACNAMMRYPGKPYPHSVLAAKVMSGEMLKRFYTNDPTVTAIITKETCDHLSRIEKKRELVACLYAVTLRALHFENSIAGTPTYSSITEEDCKNAVLNSAYYKKEIEKTPYYKDSIVSGATSSIMKERPFLCFSDFEWGFWALRDIHFVDSVCNYIWKEIASEYENGDTRDVEEIVNILYDYTQNSAD